MSAQFEGRFGDGVFWTICTDAVTTNFPADNAGTATGTNTSSVLFGSKIVQLLGHIIVTEQVAGTVTYANNGGANFVGMTFPADILNETEDFGNPGDGRRLVRFTNANVGLKCSAGVVAIFFWRQLL